MHVRVHVCEGYVLPLADHERRAYVLGMIKPLLRTIGCAPEQTAQCI